MGHRIEPLVTYRGGKHDFSEGLILQRRLPDYHTEAPREAVQHHELPVLMRETKLPVWATRRAIERSGISVQMIDAPMNAEDAEILSELNAARESDIDNHEPTPAEIEEIVRTAATRAATEKAAAEKAWQERMLAEAGFAEHSSNGNRVTKRSGPGRPPSEKTATKRAYEEANVKYGERVEQVASPWGTCLVPQKIR